MTHTLDELEAIRARHEVADGGYIHGYLSPIDAENAHTDRATLLRLLDAVREVKEAAFDAGFMASGEGWNGEYPGDASQSDYYKEQRAKALSALTQGETKC
jgi:hypothetical protein